MSDQKNQLIATQASVGRAQLIPWALLVAVLFLAYLTRGILLPFLAGFAVAYLLDPIADKMETVGINRGFAAGSIIVFAVLVCTAVGLGLYPLLYAQITDLITAVPDIVEQIRTRGDLFITDLHRRFGEEVGNEAQSVMTSAIQQGLIFLHNSIGRIFAGGLAFFNLLALLLISPMVAFYLLRDFDQILGHLNNALPATHAPIIRTVGRDIDRVLSGFVRGQLSVMLIMAVLYAIGWSSIGLNYAVLLGLLAGLLAIIPFLGMLFAVVLALIVGFSQWGMDWVNLGLVSAVWLFVQALEGTILTPRLLGRHVGLHPVWVLFAVFAGGEVAGFVGVLLAVPAAAVIAVLVRFGYDSYRKRSVGLAPDDDNNRMKQETV